MRIRPVVAFAVGALVMGLSTSAPAKVVELEYRFFYYPEGTSCDWSFDYDLQQLTVVQNITDIGYVAATGFKGKTDAESVFSVVWTATNDTGVTWTSFGFDLGPPPAGTGGHKCVGGIMPETMQSTKLQTISPFAFCGSPVVPDGESFTMEFDVLACGPGPYSTFGRIDVNYSLKIVPEPATACLFGLGALVLLRQRQRCC